MDFTWFGVMVIAFWVFSGLLIFPMVVALELMICQLCKRKWLRVIPVLAGVVILYPVAYICQAGYIAGISLQWWTLAGGFVLSLAGSAIGWLIHRKVK